MKTGSVTNSVTVRQPSFPAQTVRLNTAPAWRLRMTRPDRGNAVSTPALLPQRLLWEELGVNGLIYLIGLIVVVLFILSFLGLRWGAEERVGGWKVRTACPRCP